MWATAERASHGWICPKPWESCSARKNKELLTAPGDQSMMRLHHHRASADSGRASPGVGWSWIAVTEIQSACLEIAIDPDDPLPPGASRPGTLAREPAKGLGGHSGEASHTKTTRHRQRDGAGDRWTLTVLEARSATHDGYRLVALA